MKNKELPLVEHISTNLFANVNLERTLLIACQHILKPQYKMFLSLFKKGLRPSNTFLLGKCYSTDKQALSLFVGNGVNVHKASEYFDSHKSYDAEYQRNVENFLAGIAEKINLKKFDKIILLDDGGFLIIYANKYLKNFKNIMGIEQTSSGYSKIKEEKLNFPVINVARCKAKLIHETPAIVNQSIENLNHELKKLKLKPKKVLIIGNGFIGKGIADKLKNNYRVSSYDIRGNQSDLDDIKSYIENFDLIIGCTGKSSLPIELFSKLKKNAVLASVSSSDREFFASNLRQLTKNGKDCHENNTIRDIVLLNSGFPITFSNDSLGIEEKYIQLTIALLFSAICLDSKKFSNGLVDLDENVQNEIVKKYYEIMRN